MATPSTMIIRSLQMIGMKAMGASLTSDEQTAYLSALNAMMESWSLERLMVYQILQESKSLTASVGSLTIGSGATFNTTRPIKLVDPCFTRDASNIDRQLTLINAEEYGRITQKTLDGTYPEYLYYDAAYASGLATIYLYPEPISGLTLYINSWKQLQTFALISTTVSLPPGYQRAIESNLAIELSAGLRPVPPEVVRIARESKAAIKNVNAPADTMRLDVGVVENGSRWNIYTGS